MALTPGNFHCAAGGTQERQLRAYVQETYVRSRAHTTYFSVRTPQCASAPDLQAERRFQTGSFKAKFWCAVQSSSCCVCASACPLRLGTIY